MTPDLLSLATRCEEATGANKMLDEAIYEAVGAVPIRHHSFVYPHYAYTASLDCAMSLVPEGREHDWSLIGGSYWQAEVADESADAATPALALCAAALRARAAQ